jgi:hydrogenase maturation protease
VATRLLIVGFGNPLAADDGAGPAVVARLLEMSPPAGVRCEDGGSDSLRLPTLWRGEQEVWLVDAVARGTPPGSIHRLDHEGVMSVPQRHATVHHLSLPESLRWIALAYPEMAHVRYRFWGIEVSRVALHAGLSPAVAQAVVEVASEVARDILRCA